MQGTPNNAPSLSTPTRGLANAVRRTARASARRPKTALFLWMALIVGLIVAGSMVGTREITDVEAGVGESGDAVKLIEAANLEDPAVESILVTSDDPAQTSADAAALASSVSDVKDVSKVSATDDPDLIADGGRAQLVQVTLRGDPDDAPDHVTALERRVQSFDESHPGTTVEQAGEASLTNAMDKIVEDDLGSAETISLPVILIILALAFGALVAASVPLLLGVTATAGAIGAAGLVSQIAPSEASTTSVVVLIGLAVGVDYSLFYIRREREERRAGKGTEAAIDATAATVGRAVVVSGMTVMVALAGLLITGLAVFESMALATMVVVLLAVIGSVTALPALLELLGTKVDRGRLPFVSRIRARRERSGRVGGWERIVTVITRRPVTSLIASVAVLGAIAVPAFGMHLADSSTDDLPQDEPTIQALNHIDQQFPGAPSDVQLVVAGSDLGSQTGELEKVGDRALAITGGSGSPQVTVADDGSAASIKVPMPDTSRDEATDIVGELRSALGEVGGNEVLVTGDAAESADFTAELNDAMPIVLAGVLGLAFLLLLAAFRSPWLAAGVVALNLISVGAAYGVLTAVFQHGIGADLIGVTETGSVGSWVPLFSFVILFGLSMDYTVIVLERIREGRERGLSAREAVTEGVGATAGAVTSAAAVMVAVFSLFALQRMPEMQQLGVGLGAAVLIDATIVRAVALPALVTLLGERRWKVATARRFRRHGGRGEIIATAPKPTMRPLP